MQENKYNENLYIKWLEMIESNIIRMSNLSEQNKKFAFAITTALIALIPSRLCINPNYIVTFSIVGQMVLMLLNIYYLSLEHAFRDKFNMIAVMMNSQTKTNDYLSIELEKGYFKKYFIKSLISFSIWPVYVTLIVMSFISLYINNIY